MSGEPNKIEEKKKEAEKVVGLWREYTEALHDLKDALLLFLKDQNLETVLEGNTKLNEVIQRTQDLEKFLFRPMKDFSVSVHRVDLLIKFGDLYHSLMKLGFFCHEHNASTIEDRVVKSASSLVALVSLVLAVPIER